MRRYAQPLLILGFTAVLIGYLSVWLRGPGVGLTFLGVEMGEWFKFLGLGPRRDLFYLPPIALGLMLALWTMTWPSKQGVDWRAWSVRGLAVLISLLAFPALEDISGAVREQYLLRAALVLLVTLVSLASALWQPKGAWRTLPWTAMALLGGVGALLPTWQFLQVQPFLAEILGVALGTGIGVWLNLLGNALVTAVAIFQTVMVNRPTSTEMSLEKSVTG